MGFRCPSCRADFGHDRDTFKQHLAGCELGNSVVSMTLEITDDSQNQAAFGLTKPTKSRPVAGLS